MKNIIVLIFVFIFVSCSDTNIISDSDQKMMSEQPITTRATVDLHNKSITNPSLLDNWENVQTIELNTSGNHSVSAPWASGTASSLTDTFRKDIKKEDGWTMLFHTFKQKGLDEKQNYMCFYNQFTGVIKVFYYYEGERASQGTQWYIKTADGSNSKLFNLTEFLASPDDVYNINMAVFSNQVGDPTKGLQTGWNGFEFEVPYCTDYKNKEFVLGAYDRIITKYDFSGNVNLNTGGTITPMGGGGNGWLSTVASLGGYGAKALVDNSLSTAKNPAQETKKDTIKFGQKLAEAIKQVPASNYSQLISAGLGLIFGKTTTVNNYDVRLTTNGKVEFGGTGTTETTSGIPSITFNLYSLMNSDKKVEGNSSFVYNPADGSGHYIGVWNMMSSPKVYYKRITEMSVPANWQVNSDGSVYSPNVKIEAPSFLTRYDLVVNPDLEKYGNVKSKFLGLSRCDSLNGQKYVPKMIDIGDFLHSSLQYRDRGKLFFNIDGFIETDMRIPSKDRYNKRNFYFDWGNIDCGRQVICMGCDCNFTYNGKSLVIQQTRLYPAGYGVDLGVIDDISYYNEGDRMIVNSSEPFYEYQKKRNGIPIIDYEY